MNMSEQHPSVSAVGSHFDEEATIDALAQRYYEKDGRPEGRFDEYRLRAERDFRAQVRREPAEASATSDDPESRRFEEAMHLRQ
jgi:hypothetical protein